MVSPTSSMPGEQKYHEELQVNIPETEIVNRKELSKAGSM